MCRGYFREGASLDNTTIHAKEVARFTARGGKLGQAEALEGARAICGREEASEAQRGVRTERPRGSGVRRTGVRRAERGAGAEGQARRARARAACVDGRSRWSGRAIGVVSGWTGRARVSSRLERGGGLLTEQHQAAAPPAREPYTRRRRVRSIAASHFASMLSSGGRVAVARGQVTNPRWRRVQNLVGTLIC